MLEALILLFGGPLMLLALMLLLVPGLLWSSWIAAHIWALLLVPLGAQPVRWVAFFGLALVLACLRPVQYPGEQEEDKGFGDAVARYLFISYGAPALAWGIAAVVAHFAF